VSGRAVRKTGGGAREPGPGEDCREELPPPPKSARGGLTLPPPPLKSGTEP
jgi:hypothetical protein